MSFWHGISCVVPSENFAVAVRYAPKTRPGRYTILERLELTEAEILSRLGDFDKVVAG